ncbi:SIMPL domain-containing protein [Mycobacteroides abscessus subsp. massiliense]|uniref:SIMPL domain-containing protein n=1 Tax=Mycobacteroides abscessus TaxID=36809 RepID=UPI00266C4608|nr:SIMPL domain-containing protein [Mycobacteroides abscessus]MDO3299669.1 SIMPL domain-containing protein [Mycobacteroides abscessus subsp. massiliense]
MRVLARKALTRTTAIAGAAALAVLLAGCGDDSTGGPESSRNVTVVGKGEVKGAPDVLRADVGVSVTAKDVSGALSQASEKAQAVIDAVVGAGVARKDVQTNELSIQPEQTYPPGGPTRITGYNATNSVRINVRDLKKASEVLDKAVQAGGDAARLSSVSFDLDNDADLMKGARERAFNDAKSRAEQYAALSGSTLGKVLRIDESHGSVPPPPPPMGKRAPMQADASFAPPLEPGQQTVSFQVSVIWELD